MRLLEVKYEFDKRRKKMNVEKWIARQNWTFAKTYATRAPHEYVVRGYQNGSDDEFKEVMEYIEKNGMEMYFWKHPNKYIYVDGHYYWVMKDEKGLDDPTAVINRSDENDYRISIVWKGNLK